MIEKALDLIKKSIEDPKVVSTIGILLEREGKTVFIPRDQIKYGIKTQDLLDNLTKIGADEKILQKLRTRLNGKKN